MGSSDTGTSGAGVVDSNSSVGTIVWVRRRNGSWWPGKILGPQELSASHLMSPRSGTPVKLLGREDASVDWYNLDKSKRVKAFRCGEFDDCIERAEASHGMPPKKREKYARREDAIMHALELEKQFLEKQYGKSGSNYKSSKSSDGVRKQSATSNNAKHLDPKSHQTPGQRDLAPEGSICGDLQIHDLGNQLSGDDDNSDALPRMRGLQDLGLGTASSNLSVDPSALLKSPTNDTAHSPLNGAISIENTSHTNDKTSSDKRKRPSEGLAEESLVKRHDKRRPLVQVLESSAKLPAPPLLKPEDSIVSLFVRGEEQGIAKRSKDVDQTKSSDSTDNTESHSNHIEVSPSKLENNSNTLPATGIKDSTSGSTEDTETDSSETDSLESDTDEEMADISDESIEFRPKSRIKSEEQEHGSMSSEADDPGTTSDMSHPSHDDNVSASAGVSKWKLKGKRNTRSLTKRHVDISGGIVSRGSNPGTKLTGKGSYDSDETDLFDKNYRNRIRGYRSRGLDGIRPNITSWEDLAWNDQPVAKAYWGDSIEYMNPVFVSPHFGDRRKCMLVEVDLKVQSRYHREHVPMISLMSKLNGQAIVGHPIQIEALENGSSEALLATANELNQDYDTAAPPVWMTARRTANYRVPCPRSSTSVDGDEGTEDSQHVHQDRKVPSNKSNGGNLNPKASLAGKSSGHGSRPSTDRKLLKKPAKKTNVTSNQKTRTLSSIATQQKHSNHLKHGSNSNNVNGLIKPESLPAAVACIPIKLVFSRLNEKLVGRRK